MEGNGEPLDNGRISSELLKLLLPALAAVQKNVDMRAGQIIPPPTPRFGELLGELRRNIIHDLTRRDVNLLKQPENTFCPQIEV